MTFNEAVEKIMPLVNEGDTTIPFILNRLNGDWEISYVNYNVKANDALDLLRETDPYAVMFTGGDFSKGKFGYVYDRIVNERLRTEYEHADFSNANPAELRALINMIEENVGEFTQEETDYLMMFDRPLAALYDMNKISLVSRNPDDDYNYAQTGAFFTAVGNEIHDRLYNLKKQEIPAEHNESEKSDKRVIEGYEEKICIEIAGKYVVLAENQAKTEPYLICNIKYDNPLNYEERYAGVVTDNYVEAMREFVNRVDGFVGELESERHESGLPFQTLTAAEHCISDSHKSDYEGKLVIVKPDILAPEYKSAEHQLAIALHGFGCNPESSGRAVYVMELHSGKKCRYDRHQIAGVADIEKLPQWAKDKFTEYHNKDESSVSVYSGAVPQTENKEKEESPEKPPKKPTLQEKLDKAKKKAADNPANKGNGDKPKKRDERE